MALDKRVLSIDFGMARLGLAISDPTKLIATPLETFPADRKIESTARKLVAFLDSYAQQKKCQIETIVIGMPLMMSGKKGFLADEVMVFIEQLKLITSIPIITWDERLTTVMAERSLKESSLNRKRRSQHVDAVSAVILLQNYLDSLRFHN